MISVAQIQPEVLDTTLNLPEVVVTGSRSERPITHTPGNVQIVSPLLLKHAPAESVDEVLTLISGVHSTRSSGMSQMYTNVSIRGLSGNEQGRTLVLWDGIPINVSDEGSVNWNSIPLHAIQRIEVFKGSGSSLYGNNAMGGVINIISKRPAETLSVQLHGAYGSLQTWKSGCNLSGRINERWAWLLSGYAHRSDGYNPIPQQARSNPDYSVARYMQEKGMYAKVLFAPSALLRMELSCDFYRDKRGEGEKIEAVDGEYRRFNHNRYQLRLSGERGKGAYQLAFYWGRQHYFKLDERLKKEVYQRFDVKSHRDDWGVILQLNLHSQLGDFLLGGELKNGSVDGGDYYVTSPDKILNQGTMTISSFFLQGEWEFLKKRFWLQTALRYDYAFFHKGWFESNGENTTDFYGHQGALKSHAWGHFSPRVALRFNPNQFVSIYLSYSQGFRISILDDLCRSGWMWVGPKVANPNLQPEQLNHYEVGGTFHLTSSLTIAPSFYYARGKDFLYYVATGEKVWGQQDIFRRENVSQIEMKGWEWDLDYKPISGLKVNVNYAYNLPKIKHFEKKEELNGKILTYAPKHQLKGYLLWTGGVVEAMIRGQYKSMQYTTEDNLETISNFSVWDVQISKYFFERKLNIGLSIQNLFDCRYMNTKELESVGRYVNLKLAFHLNLF